MIPNPLTLEELTLIILLSLPLVLWGLQHGLDAAIIAVVGVLAGMLLSDPLANALSGVINTFARMGRALAGAGSGADFFTQFSQEPGLITTPEQAQFLGSIIFIAISFIGLRIARRRAGGRANFFDGLLGALGALVTSYLFITYLFERHVGLPQEVVINPTTELPGFVTPTDIPNVVLDPNVLVLVLLVIIAYGVQTTRRKSK
jgi:hypothetical protein